jgi:hypothetical protein
VKKIQLGNVTITVRKASPNCDSSRCGECKDICEDRIGKYFDPKKKLAKGQMIAYLGRGR